MQISDIKAHFEKRAQKYNNSAKWVKDEKLLSIIKELSCVKKTDLVLDAACGTGVIAGIFSQKAKQVIGFDVTEKMFSQALPKLDYFVCALGESLPFRENTFDIITCRQGLQFMDALAAVKEMYRVSIRGARIILVQLTAFGKEDMEHAFKIQLARQPVRENCFLEEDLVKLLRKAGCKQIKARPYYSFESVNGWINNGALSLERQEQIKKLYQDAPLEFSKIHEVKFIEDDIIDKMKISVVCGYK